MAATMVMEFTDRIFLSNYSVDAISAALPAGVPTFIMWSIGISSLLCMLLPISIGIEFFDQGIYYAWGCVLLFVAVLFVLAASATDGGNSGTCWLWSGRPWQAGVSERIDGGTWGDEEEPAMPEKPERQPP